MRKSGWTTVAILAAAAIAAACSDSGPTAPATPGSDPAAQPAAAVPAAPTSAQTNQDIAAAAAAAIAGDLASLSANEWAIGLGSPLGALVPTVALGSDAPRSSDTSKTKSDSGNVKGDTTRHHDSPKASGDSARHASDTSKTKSDSGKSGDGKSGASTGGGSKEAPAGCQPTSVPGTFSCAGNVTESVSTSRQTWFFDAAGAAMANFVRGVTASVRFVVRIDRSSSRDSTYRSVRHSSSDQLLSGLLTTRRIWDGTSASSDTNSHRDGAILRTYAGVSHDTLKAVTYEAERSVNKYPLSGSTIRSISYVQSVEGRENSRLTVSRRIVVTYNGTALVPMQVGNVSCTLNLDTRKAEGCK